MKVRLTRVKLHEETQHIPTVKISQFLKLTLERISLFGYQKKLHKTPVTIMYAKVAKRVQVSYKDQQRPMCRSKSLAPHPSPVCTQNRNLISSTLQLILPPQRINPPPLQHIRIPHRPPNPQIPRPRQPRVDLVASLALPYSIAVTCRRTHFGAAGMRRHALLREVKVAEGVACTFGCVAGHGGCA